MYPSVSSIFPKFNKDFEGYVNWMYLDIKGLVTIGIGNLIDPLAYAINLPFVHKSDGHSATQAEIIFEWRKVKLHTQLAQQGYRAAKNLTELMLTDESIDRFVIVRMYQNEAILKKTFPEWESWPADAQLGILSMSWAMGPGFTKFFPKFTAHCKAQAWDLIAALDDNNMSECYINSKGNPGVIRRNHTNRELFETAAETINQPDLDKSIVYGYEVTQS